MKKEINEEPGSELLEDLEDGLLYLNVEGVMPFGTRTVWREVIRLINDREDGVGGIGAGVRHDSRDGAVVIYAPFAGSDERVVIPADDVEAWVAAAEATIESSRTFANMRLEMVAISVAKRLQLNEEQRQELSRTLQAEVMGESCA